MSDKGPSHTAASTRLHVLIAAEARTAVVFRRGPSKQVRMLRWDLATDRVVGGQWLSGRLYLDRCDLSPDGELLVYFCGKFNAKVHAFTAVSRPPFFTALAFWPERLTYGGGGTFVGNRELRLNWWATESELRPAGIPEDFTIVNPASAPEPVARLADTRPSPVDETMVLSRRVLGVNEPNGPSRTYGYHLERSRPSGAKVVACGELDWAGWDHDGALLFARDGCLFRSRAEDWFGEAPPVVREVADLRQQTFENVAPPDEATRWPRA